MENQGTGPDISTPLPEQVDRSGETQAGSPVLQARQLELERENEALRFLLQDLAEWKRAQEAALDSTVERLESIGALARVGGWELDLPSMKVVWSLETFRIHEVDPPEAPSLDQAIQFYAPEGRPAIQAAIQAGIEHGTPWDLELPLITAKGRRIWVRAQGSALREKGKTVKLRGAFQDLTERKLAEGALRQSETRFRDIAQVTGDWIWEIDADGRYTYVSGSVQKLLGFRAEDILGRTPFDLMPPAEATRVGAIFAGIAATRANFRDLENAIQHRDGSLRHVLTSGVAILDPQGQLLGYRGLDRDITDHKLAESYRELGRDILQILNEPGDLQVSLQRVLAALKQHTGVEAAGIRLQDGDDYPYFAQIGFSREFLQRENSLVERFPGGGVCRDAQGEIRLECTCGLVISGRTDPSNPLFTPGGSAWTCDSAPILDLPLQADPRNHPRNTCIHQGYASIALVPIRNNNRVVGLIQLNDRRKGCFTLDVIEYLEGIAQHLGSALMRKQAEETLRESEERYRVMVDFAPEAILVYDIDGSCLVDVNPNAERLLGLPRGELIGKRLPDFFGGHPSPAEPFATHLELALAGQESVFERPVLRSDGEVRQCEVRLVRLPSKSRRLIRASLLDITERRQHELLVGEMKSLAAKGNVAAYIAHEINNPLAGIRNSFKLVARAIPKDHPHFPFTQVISTELDRIASIVRTIYSLYRPNPAPSRVVILDETLSDVIQILAGPAQDREVSLELKPSCPPIRGLIHEDLLRQALFNLLQNALDATPPGGRVVCGGRILGEELRVEVEDGGPGIPPDLGSRIFEPGFSTKKAVELSGLGLGLDTCRKLMEAVGGSIDYRNLKPGPGAVFSLHFPWKPAANRMGAPHGD